MGRTRDVSKILTANTSLLTLASASSTFLPQASASVIYQGPPNRNLIINGAMQVAQRATSLSSITTSLYKTADRWALSFAGAQNFGTWTQSIENDGPTDSGFSKSLKMLCTTAQASPGSSAALIFYQVIEGQNLQGVKKGTPQAQPLTVSFWVKSNVTGTYVCSLLDENNSIGFPPYGTSIARTYTVNAINTWEKKTLTFSAGTSGVIANTSAAGLRLYHWLGAGSNYQSGTLNSTWASNAPGTEAVGQINVASAVNNYWQVTGIQLEIGSTATPFEYKPYAQDLLECMRYLQVWKDDNKALYSGHYWSATESLGTLHFKIPMRSAPTLTASSGTAIKSFDGVGQVQRVSSSINTDASNINGIDIAAITAASTAGRATFNRTNGAGSYLWLSAEL